MSRIQERGRARLKLRLPAWARRFELASSQSFLDVCESYELAWVGLELCMRSDTPDSRGIIADYRELVASLELEAQHYATRDAEPFSPRR